MGATAIFAVHCGARTGTSAGGSADARAVPPTGPTALERLCAAAAPVCDQLRGSSAPDLLRAKLSLEARLGRQTGYRFACAAPADECIAKYVELGAQDWTTRRPSRGTRVLLAADVASVVGEGQAVVSLRGGGGDLQSLLGHAPAPASDVAAVVNEQLATPPARAEAVPGCDQSRAFYDRLFARDEILATVAFGYLDEHLPTLRGYLRHVLLKLDPVPVFLRSQDELLAQVRALFSRSGYGLDASGPTELVLSKRFDYRGQPKTLRVRVVFSIARCSGETPDEFGRLWRFDDQTCPEQRQATNHARAQLAKSFATDAIVIYHGHARVGRGLDFGAMGLDDGKVSFDCDSLACPAPGTSQTLVFLNGCDTLRYYGAAVAKFRQALPADHAFAWLGTRDGALTMNAPQMTLRLLDLLIEAKCPDDIIAVMNLPRLHPEDVSQIAGEGF